VHLILTIMRKYVATELKKHRISKTFISSFILCHFSSSHFPLSFIFHINEFRLSERGFAGFFNCLFIYKLSDFHRWKLLALVLLLVKSSFKILYFGYGDRFPSEIHI
jgi:hypothetical protein